MSNFLDLLGRIFISAIFLFSGINKIFNYENTIQWMEGFGITGTLLIPTIALEIIFPILIMGTLNSSFFFIFKILANCHKKDKGINKIDIILFLLLQNSGVFTSRLQYLYKYGLSLFL